MSVILTIYFLCQIWCTSAGQCRITDHFKKLMFMASTFNRRIQISFSRMLRRAGLTYISS